MGGRSFNITSGAFKDTLMTMACLSGKGHGKNRPLQALVGPFTNSAPLRRVGHRVAMSVEMCAPTGAVFTMAFA